MRTEPKPQDRRHRNRDTARPQIDSNLRSCCWRKLVVDPLGSPDAQQLRGGGVESRGRVVMFEGVVGLEFTIEQTELNQRYQDLVKRTAAETVGEQPPILAIGKRQAVFASAR